MAENLVNENSENIDEVTQSLAPSHIVQDGRYIYLPAPTKRERNHFFERSIARHGLLEADIAGTADQDDVEEDKKEKEPKVHPLALASASLEANGINELNRAINLNTLTSTGEFFGLANIVDPSLEISTTTATSASVDAASGSAAATASGKIKAGGALKSESEVEVQEEQRVKASYVLKRKRAQFEKASSAFRRHRRRLAAAVVAQARPDCRLRNLRPQWRLVAPEHGTRALPHAVRPTEVVAFDVDVYKKEGSSLSRLAKRVPRYATMELKDNYLIDQDLKEWETRHFPSSDEMEIDKEEKAGEAAEKGTKTRVEPFAIADPTLGKLDADFDPQKVTMLTLQFDVEKASTGFCQTACLEPISTIGLSQQTYNEDEKVLVALQHSLFCAKLFESIRRELAPDTEDIGQIRTLAKTQSVVWLSGESDENFLPSPSLTSGIIRSDLSSLCVVHCHEGEVKVQLDCEYTLRVKLVEAGDDSTNNSNTVGDDSFQSAKNNSGSQTPAQLSCLCRALLLHAQEVYHKHSIHMAARLQKNEEEKVSKNANTNVNPNKKKEVIPSPRILQTCVNLGAKMLFERRIRRTIMKVNSWLNSSRHTNERLQVEWLPLSVFDPHSQFSLTFRSWSIDVHLACEQLTITRTSDDGDYQKVKFQSDSQFELYLKIALHRLLSRQP